MTEEKYNTKDIRHIDEKNQEYIAKGNRMTEEIIKEEFDKAFKKHFPDAVIIDGIDVSECYADNKMMKDGLYCFWEGGNCKDNEYCYFKECKRLEQENKEEKKAYNECMYYLACMTEQRNKLKTALEEIKSSVMDYLPKVNYKFAKSFHPEAFKLLESIVNKINEVLQ